MHAAPRACIHAFGVIRLFGIGPTMPSLPRSLRTRRTPLPQAAIEYRGSNRTIYNNAEWLNGWSVLRPLLPASLPFFCSNSPMCASALVERRTQPLQIRASVSLISPSSPSLQSVPPLPTPVVRRPRSLSSRSGQASERERDGPWGTGNRMDLWQITAAPHSTPLYGAMAPQDFSVELLPDL